MATGANGYASPTRGCVFWKRGAHARVQQGAVKYARQRSAAAATHETLQTTLVQPAAARLKLDVCMAHQQCGAAEARWCGTVLEVPTRKHRRLRSRRNVAIVYARYRCAGRTDGAAGLAEKNVCRHASVVPEASEGAHCGLSAAVLRACQAHFAPRCSCK